MKKCDIWAKFRTCLCFFQPHSHHLVRFYPLSSFPSTAFCVFGCIFHLVDVVPDTGFGAHNQKISLRKFLGITGKRLNIMHISCDWVSNIHSRSKHVKYYRYLTYLTLPPATNFYVFGKRTRVLRPVTKFN